MWLRHREEIAGCSERAYESLSVEDARKLMLFSSDQEAAAFAEEVGVPCDLLRCLVPISLLMQCRLEWLSALHHHALLRQSQHGKTVCYLWATITAQLPLHKTLCTCVRSAAGR